MEEKREANFKLTHYLFGWSMDAVPMFQPLLLFSALVGEFLGAWRRQVGLDLAAAYFATMTLSLANFGSSARRQRFEDEIGVGPHLRSTHVQRPANPSR